MDSRFNERDVVKIAKRSNYYNRNCPEDPKNVEGIITSTWWQEDNENPIRVEWSNGESNIYNDRDLGLVRRYYE